MIGKRVRENRFKRLRFRWFGAVAVSAWCLMLWMAGMLNPLQAETPIANGWQDSPLPSGQVQRADEQATPSPASSKTIPPAVHLPLVRLPPPTLYLPLALLPNPLFPTQPHPPDGAAGQSPNTFLAWSTFTSTVRPVRYDLYLEADNPAPSVLLAQGLARPAFDPYTFALDTQYYWRVIATDDQGLRAVGPVWTFRIEAQTWPPDIEAMIEVPAGEFQMGCDAALSPVGGCTARKDTPLHTVYLDAYAIDKYEVTNLQYRACVDAGVCPRPMTDHSLRRRRYFIKPEYNYFPVVYVSWRNAQTYCAWQGKRLSTEAEWEKAARGPIDTRTWPWGEEFPDCNRANYTDDRIEPSRNWVVCTGDTDEVGSHPSGASPYGLMDVAGNVFEWVYDRLDIAYNIHYYEISPYANPTGPEPLYEEREGPFYVIRGGSFRPRWRYVRTFHRHHGHRGGTSELGIDVTRYRNDQVGFRCARSLAVSNNR
jgi:formylglycine-generating enzyme required for sulfatase activity